MSRHRRRPSRAARRGRVAALVGLPTALAATVGALVAGWWQTGQAATREVALPPTSAPPEPAVTVRPVAPSATSVTGVVTPPTTPAPDPVLVVPLAARSTTVDPLPRTDRPTVPVPRDGGSRGSTDRTIPTPRTGDDSRPVARPSTAATRTEAPTGASPTDDRSTSPPTSSPTPAETTSPGPTPTDGADDTDGGGEDADATPRDG